MRALTFFALLLGCGEAPLAMPAGPSDVGCMRDARLEPYAPGMQAVGEAGFAVRLVESVPAPPARFDNRFTVEVLGPTGALDTEVQLSVSARMPLAGLDAPKAVTVTGAAGRFVLEPVSLAMPGLWHVRLEITRGDVRDQAVLAFCIPG